MVKCTSKVFGFIDIALFVSHKEREACLTLKKYCLHAQHICGSFQLTLAFWLFCFSAD